MAYDRLFTWTSRPPVGTPINRRSPLAIGIQALLPCNEGSGLPWNVANNERCTLVSGSSVAWGPAGILCTLGSGPIIQVAENIPQVGQLWSAGLVFNFSAFQASSPFISALVYNNFTICRMGDSGLADNQPQILYGSTRTNASGISVGLHSLVVTLGPASGGNVTQTLYVDGTAACAQTTTYYSDPNSYSTLFSDGTSGRQPAGSLYVYGEWGRCLSAGEVASWSANPWQLFSSPIATRYFPSGSTAHSVFFPASLSGLGSGGPFFSDPLGRT